MTAEDQLLLFTLYAQQTAKFNLLYELLKSRGIVEGDDLDAYLELFKLEKREQLDSWMAKSWASYQSILAGLGIALAVQVEPPSSPSAG
jgi:hypothetical protein